MCINVLELFLDNLRVVNVQFLNLVLEQLNNIQTVLKISTVDGDTALVSFECLINN